MLVQYLKNTMRALAVYVEFKTRGLSPKEISPEEVKSAKWEATERMITDALDETQYRNFKEAKRNYRRMKIRQYRSKIRRYTSTIRKYASKVSRVWYRRKRDIKSLYARFVRRFRKILRLKSR